MTTKQIHLIFGGSFAPPLTDELLARYAAIIAGLDPKERTTAILRELEACAIAWWNEPESGGNGKPHPVFGSKVAMIDLDAEIAARLWDTTPWADDLEAWKPILETLEAEPHARNQAKLAVWRPAVMAALYAEIFPGQNVSSVESCYGLYRVVLRVSSALMPAQAAVACAVAATAVAFPGWKGNEIFDQVNQLAARYIEIMNGTSPSPVPKPSLEPTPIRDMAHSLLWHACELERDREPLTADKVRA